MTILSRTKQWIQCTLGRFQWTKPHWLQTKLDYLSQRPLLITTITLLIGISLGAVLWYKHQPKPVYIEARITAPKATPLAEELIPSPVVFTFGTLQGSEFTPKSVAPLGSIGKTKHPEIHIKPEMPGQWIWETDDRLVFTPAQDWPPTQDYTVTFDKSGFTNPKIMSSLQYHFTTDDLKPKLDSFRFYQDPIDANIREAVATLSFNFPIDIESLKSHINLSWQTTESSSNETIPFKLTFDKHKRTAYIHTETIALPKTPRYLVLTLEKGIASASHTDKTDENIQKTLLIPDSSTYFKLIKANALIMHDEQAKPQQILTIETSIGAEEHAMAKGIHAWILPKDNADKPEKNAQGFYIWQNPGEVSQKVLLASTPIKLTALPAGSRYANGHGFRFNVPHGGYLYVKIDQGTKGMGGFALKHDYQTILSIPAYPQEIRLIHHGSLLALTGEKKVSFGIRGIENVQFSIARVLPDNVTQLVTQTEGRFDSPYFLNESFNQDNISEVFSEIRSLSSINPAREQYTSLDLEKFINPNNLLKGPKGLFLLTAQKYDIQNKVASNPKTQRLILITDLGMLVKDNADQTHDVFVQSITQGAPVVGVAVSILGKNGLPLLTHTTDADGRVTFPDLSEYMDEHRPAVYLATQGSDVSFIPYKKLVNELNYSRFDIDGLQTSTSSQQISAYVFSDRGIYRPADTAQFGIIVKKAYGQSLPEGLPVEVTITDPRGNNVLLEKTVINPAGFLTLSFPTKATSPTGTYNLNVFLEKNGYQDSLLGYTSFKVQEFLPDRLRINVRFSKPDAKGWLLEKDLDAYVSLYNLYGAPATERRITGKLIFTPIKLAFKEFPDYIFTDAMQDPEKPLKTITETLPDTSTDSKGQAKLPLSLENLPQGTFMMTFLTEGFEAGAGRSVTAQAKTLISPLPFAIGYKASSDLQFITQNAPRQLHLIAVSPALKQIALPHLKIRLSEIHPVTSLVKKADGTFAYQSLSQTHVISTQPFSLEANGSNYTLPTDKPGQFILSLLDENDKPVGRIDYRVNGAGALNLSKNAELSLRLNKDNFKSGEPIILDIIAPYTGTGLITIEQDKVYAAKWFKTDKESTLETITLPDTLKGNAYVNVTFTRDWESPETLMSPLSFGIAPFSIDKNNAVLPITLDLSQTVKPGEDLTISYHTDKPAKIVIFGVDEGILQVARYKTPDPLGWFFQKRALMVTTMQTLDQILPKFISNALSTVGGDEGEDMINAQLNPFKRQSAAPVAFWSDLLDANETMRQFHYHVPDYFNGTLKVMAVAAGDDTLGAAEKSMPIHADFVINPNVPTFVAPNDEFTLSASIANQLKETKDKQPIVVTIKTSNNLTLLDGAEQTITLKPNTEKSVTFRLKAGQSPGEAKITLTTQMDDKKTQALSTLSIRPASLFKTEMTSGSTHQSKLNVPMTQHLYPQFAHIQAMVSQNPLILVSGLARYLDEYPYGCTEQLTSRAVPWLVMSNLPWFTENKNMLHKKLDAFLQILTERQMSDGGFSYWPTPGYNENKRFISLYTMHFLTEAKQLGTPYVNSLLNHGLQYLQDIAQKTPQSIEDARMQAYAVYLLTRNEFVTTNYLVNVQTYLQGQKDAEHDLANAYVAATYQLLKDETEAMLLIQKYDPKASVKTSDFYSQDLANTQYFYLLARHFPALAQQKVDSMLPGFVEQLNTSEISTILAGYTTLALQAYGDSLKEQGKASLTIEQIIPNQAPKLIKQNTTGQQTNDIDITASAVNFINPDKQPIFYQMTTSGFNQTTENKAVQHGMEIDREYRDGDGNTVSEVKLGDELEVHVSVRGSGELFISNAAIVDLLPGGFEIIRESIGTQDAQYIDIREDRIILFTSIDSNSKEFVYRIKATNQGTYKIPPAYVHAMYLPTLYAQTTGGSMTVL